MSVRLEEFPLVVGVNGSGVTLWLTRVHPESQRGAAALRKPSAVLLVHGGNTSSGTFLLPRGGLAQFLCDRGHDVWLLDWRSSPRVVDDLIERRTPLDGSVAAERRHYTLDVAAELDIPAALAEVRRRIGEAVELSVLGHCLGAGALAIAVSRGTIEAPRVSRVVLSTLGLFYQTPWNGWLKAEDFIIERVLFRNPECRGINPRDPESWPSDMKAAYQGWPKSWLPESGGSAARELLRHVAFMFGRPYNADSLDPAISEAELARQFGYMHLGLYQHAGQLVRRGYAARFDEADVLDRTPPSRGLPLEPPLGDLNPKNFATKRTTLLCAAENQLWHRDSIDSMYDWLRNARVGGRPIPVEKQVFTGYRLQELMWGKDAVRDVYPRIARALA